MKKYSLFILPLVLLVMPLGGCNVLAVPAYLIFGQPEVHVKAKYKGLKEKKTAIFVVSRPAIDFEYPYAATNLALASAHQISKHIKKVTFVEQDKIQDYQLENLDWLSQPVSKIAKNFDVQRLIYIDLYEFSLYEQDSVNLLRGRASAEIKIYEIDSQTPDNEVLKSEIKVSVPTQAPLPTSEENLYTVNQQAVLDFADKIAKLFYDHKEPVK